MAKQKKSDDWDDGRTIAPMTGDDLPAYRKASFSNRESKRQLKNCGKSDLTKKERRALTRAFFAVMLPRFFIILASFSIVFLILYLWLS